MTALSLALRFMLVSAAVSIVTERLRVPYTIALVVAGLAIGNMHLGQPVSVSPEVLLLVLIPPLLFEGGLRLPPQHLKTYWGLIGLLAVPGTVVTALALGWMTSGLFHLPLRSALLLGAIVSAIDPVSVQALMRELGLDLRLLTVLDGEAVLNDGVAIILFMIVSSAGASGPVPILLRFAWLLGGGMAVGAAVAAATSYALGRTRRPQVEALGSLIAALGALLAAGAFGASGVVAVVTAGVVFARYEAGNLTEAGRENVNVVWDMIAFLANSVLFLVIGLEVPAALLLRYWPLIAALAAAGLAVRALVVYGCVAAWRSRAQVPGAWVRLLSWGGLRGGVAIALALGLDPATPGHDAVVAGAFGMVIFTLLVQGLTVRPVMRRSGLLPRGSTSGSTGTA